MFDAVTENSPRESESVMDTGEEGEQEKSQD